MHFVVFGLCMSSSWGNGHATLWRGLAGALARRGHTLCFYEKDVPYYASTRDGWQPPHGVQLQIYEDFESVRAQASLELKHTDVAITTSYCPDGRAAAALLLSSDRALTVFYDLDTPVTLAALLVGARPDYLPEEGLRYFDLVLSYTGGRALDELKTRLGAREVAPLYGWVDPETHAPAPPSAEFRSDLSYLGTFAADRQRAVQELLLRTAEALPEKRLLIGGAQYPDDFPWLPNVHFVRHLPPAQHPAFFGSSRLTLNVTRESMARYGYCPSGRLFEASACGAAIVTDTWEGLDEFFSPGTEVLPVATSEEVQLALSLSDAELGRVAEAARERTLRCHTADARVLELEAVLDRVRTSAVAKQ